MCLNEVLFVPIRLPLYVQILRQLADVFFWLYLRAGFVMMIVLIVFNEILQTGDILNVDALFLRLFGIIGE
jgi:hypothetical protein